MKQKKFNCQKKTSLIGCIYSLSINYPSYFKKDYIWCFPFLFNLISKLRNLYKVGRTLVVRQGVQYFGQQK